MTGQARFVLEVARLAIVDLAHELRRDYERGVFSRQTLAVIGVSLGAAVVSGARGEWVPAGIGVAIAAWLTYLPAREDRRWRAGRRSP